MTAYDAAVPAEGEAPAVAPPVLPVAPALPAAVPPAPSPAPSVLPVPPASPVRVPRALPAVPAPSTAGGIDLGFIGALGTKFVDANCNEFNPVGFNRCCERSACRMSLYQDQELTLGSGKRALVGGLGCCQQHSDCSKARAARPCRCARGRCTHR